MHWSSPLSLFCTGSGIEGGAVDNPNIILLDVSLVDSGVYVCVLDNGAGEGHSDAFNVEVHGEYGGKTVSRRFV